MRYVCECVLYTHPMRINVFAIPALSTIMNNYLVHGTQTSTTVSVTCRPRTLLWHAHANAFAPSSRTIIIMIIILITTKYQTRCTHLDAARNASNTNTTHTHTRYDVDRLNSFDYERLICIYISFRRVYQQYNWYITLYWYFIRKRGPPRIGRTHIPYDGCS